ncbi:MAG: flagellar hook-length control protein FliK [Campylobacter lanienae]|uniref:flagellar hook-length control protein FliK n=1 Tax=Campylobacter lanienae TaxID=75658 RepID=UPI00242A7FCD|nr:flagellar hook-length control protein FliK [Campylobacter lanienae]MCI5539139.1 flagellar hook-length control protein FliK [Campylobacter lanienae]
MQGLNQALSSLNSTTQVQNVSNKSDQNRPSSEQDSFDKMIENSVQEYENSQNSKNPQDEKSQTTTTTATNAKSTAQTSQKSTKNIDNQNIKSAQNEFELIAQNSDEIMLENADFITLLALLDSQDGAMKTGISNIVSSNLNKFLAIEKNIQELKGAKNLEDLLNLSEKFNLGLSKIKITKDGVEALKSEFKNLNSKGFFSNIQPINNAININSLTKKDIESTISKLENSDKNILSKLILGQSVDINKDSKNTNLNDDEPKIQVKSEPKIDLKSDLKPEPKTDISNKTQSISSVDDYLANIMQKAIKESSEQSSKSINESLNISSSSSETTSDKGSENFDNQNGSNQATKDIINMAKLDSKEPKAHLRQVFDNFATQLQEKISEYKPPITRFHLTLNPGNLGEVEVTLINRGSNLHINFNSNTQTMQLFMQHQAEFKASLVNMGFSELSMNFSDNANKEQNQNQGKRAKFNLEANEEEINQEETILEVILPKYF